MLKALNIMVKKRNNIAVIIIIILAFFILIFSSIFIRNIFTYSADSPQDDVIQNNQESVVLTTELKDEICYEMNTYIEYCYGQGHSLDYCASETLEKVKRIYGITTEQFLEVDDYCYS